MQYLAGALALQSAFAGRIAFDTVTSSFLPRSRDMLAMRFLRSSASHLLFVDSDVGGWGPDSVITLMSAGKGAISGVYCRRDAGRTVPIRLNGKRDGELYGATGVPGGFLLLSRAMLERMVGAYHQMLYVLEDGSLAYALFAQNFEPGQPYCQEDKAFCRRWCAIGGELWVHPRVVLSHHGDSAFVPETSNGVAVLEGKTDQ